MWMPIPVRIRNIELNTFVFCCPRCSLYHSTIIFLLPHLLDLLLLQIPRLCRRVGCLHSDLCPSLSHLPPPYNRLFVMYKFSCIHRHRHLHYHHDQHGFHRYATTYYLIICIILTFFPSRNQTLNKLLPTPTPIRPRLRLRLRFRLRFCLRFRFRLTTHPHCEEYGRGCADIGCLPTEECVITSDSCSYNQRDGKDCGNYPTCKRKSGSSSNQANPSSSSSSVNPSGIYFICFASFVFILYFFGILFVCLFHLKFWDRAG